MKRKLLIALCVVIAASCVFAGCKDTGNTEKPSPSATDDSQNIENTEEPEVFLDITDGNFNIDNLKEGDIVSSFTVKSIEKQVDESGNLTNCSIVFNGELTIAGELYTDEDGNCVLEYTDEYASFLPYADGFTKEKNEVILNSDISAALFPVASGATSIEITEYIFKYSAENGVAEYANNFKTAESEYVVIG